MSSCRDAAEKVMDRLTSRLELGIMRVEQLNRMNWSQLKAIKKDAKDAQKAIEKTAETLTQHRLACEDIKFFSHLIIGRSKPVEASIPTRFNTSPGNQERDVPTSPWAMMKHFDALYNNQDKRIEQRVDKKLQERLGSPRLKSPDTYFRHTGPSFTSGGAGGETRIFALDSTSEALIPSILGHLGAGSKNEEITPEITSSAKSVFRDILILGKNILNVTEAQIETDGIRSGKSRGDIAKDIFRLKKIQGEVEAKVNGIQEALALLEKKPTSSREDHFKRLVKLSTKQQKEYRSVNSYDTDAIKLKPCSPPKKNLSPESLSNFIKRNYENFMENYEKKLELIKESEIQRKKEFKESLPSLKEKLEHIHKIENDANVLKETTAMKNKREESCKKITELKQRKEEAKNRFLSHRTSAQQLFDDWKIKNKKGEYSKVKSRFNTNTGQSKEAKIEKKSSEKVTLVRKTKPAPSKTPIKQNFIPKSPSKSALSKQREKASLTPSKPERSKSPIVKHSREKKPVEKPLNSKTPPCPLKVKKDLPPKPKPNEPHKKLNKLAGEHKPQKIAMKREDIKNKILPDELFVGDTCQPAIQTDQVNNKSEEATLVEQHQHQTESNKLPMIQSLNNLTDDPFTPAVPANDGDLSKKNTVSCIRKSISSIANTDEVSDMVLPIPACLVLEEILDSPEPLESPPATLKINNFPSSLKLCVDPACISSLPEGDPIGKPEKIPELIQAINKTRKSSLRSRKVSLVKGKAEEIDLVFDDDDYDVNRDEDLVAGDDDSLDPNQIADLDVPPMSPTRVEEAKDDSISLDADKSMEQDMIIDCNLI